MFSAMVVKDSPDLILRDEDASTIQEGNTKRINTLKSYGVRSVHGFIVFNTVLMVDTILVLGVCMLC